MARVCREAGARVTFVRLLAKARARSEPSILARELNLLGASGGQHSWHVLLDVFLPALCWVFEDVAAWTVTPPLSHDVERERHVS